MTPPDPSEAPPFNGFPPDEVAAICAAGQARRCQVGEFLFRRNEYGASMFLLEDGEVELDFGDGCTEKITRYG